MSFHDRFPKTLRSYDIARHVKPWHPELWVIETPPRLDWLKRLCMRIMTNIGALRPNYLTIDTYTFGDLQNKELLSAIMTAMRGMIERGYAPDDLVAVVGRDVWTELLGHPELRHQTFSWMAGPFGYASKSYTNRLFGVLVTYVPDIGGFCVLPRVVLERKENT